MKSSNYVCTVGPTNNSPERIMRMIYKGMSVARLNLSHGSFEENAKSIQNIRSAALRCQDRTGYFCPLGIAVDLRGPEIQISRVLKKKVEVGDDVKFNESPHFSDNSLSEIIHIDFPITNYLKRQHKVFIDDGSVELIVEEVFSSNFTCKVIKAGTLTANQSFFVPEIVKFLNLPAVSELDKLSIQFAVEHEADFIFASHVECGDWIKEIKSLLGEAGKGIQVFSKIQNRFGVDEAEEIVALSDGIIFQPTIDFEAKVIPFVQSFLLQLCKRNVKLCFTFIASDLSQIESIPEVYQAVNWFADKGDGAVISREASQGRTNPLETMKTLSIIKEMIPKTLVDDEDFSSILFGKADVMQESLASVSVRSSFNTNASVIIVISHSYVHAHLVRHYQPACEIVAVTEDPQTARQLNILDRVTPLLNKDCKIDKMNFALEFAKLKGVIKGGDTIVLLKADEGSMEIHYVSYDLKKF